MAGGAGLIIWKSIGPNLREKIWGFLDDVVEAQEQKRLAEATQIQEPLPEFREIDWTNIFRDLLTPLDSAHRSEWSSPGETAPDKPSLIDPGRKWLGVVIHPSVVVIPGRRGGGKSALGYLVANGWAILAECRTGLAIKSPFQETTRIRMRRARGEREQAIDVAFGSARQ